MKKLIRVLMSCCNEQQDSKQSERDKTADIDAKKISKELRGNSTNTREIRTVSSTQSQSRSINKLINISEQDIDHKAYTNVNEGVSPCFDVRINQQRLKAFSNVALEILKEVEEMEDSHEEILEDRV